MKIQQGKQTGASVIGLIITLVIIGYGAYVAIQYVPQVIEAQTVQSILESIQKDQRSAQRPDTEEIKRAWIRHLNINEMNELKDELEIDSYRGKVTLRVAYERELDLLYEKKSIEYKKMVTMD